MGPKKWNYVLAKPWWRDKWFVWRVVPLNILNVCWSGIAWAVLQKKSLYFIRHSWWRWSSFWRTQRSCGLFCLSLQQQSLPQFYHGEPVYSKLWPITLYFKDKEGCDEASWLGKHSIQFAKITQAAHANLIHLDSKTPTLPVVRATVKEAKIWES